MARVGPTRASAGAMLLLAVALIASTPIHPAAAAFPGANGKIAFESGRDGNQEIYVMNADGSGQTRLTNDPSSLDGEPVWSPDGTKIAWQTGPIMGSSDFEIWVMNPDGSGKTNISNSPTTVDIRPAWSPDSTRFAFVSRPIPTGNNDIWVMNADGSDRVQLTTDPGSDTEPAWSPDGSKIAFESARTGDPEIWVMNPDGSGQTNITNHPGADTQPNWSPDGTRIAFTTFRDGNAEVYVMNADGSGQTNLTSQPAFDNRPAWSPDGTRIAFTTFRSGNSEVYVMNADGSGQTNITNYPGEDDSSPDWQPLAPTPKSIVLKAKPKRVEAGDRTRLKARVKPCDGHEGDVVEFFRKKKRIATKATNGSCVAKLKVRVKRTTRFRAVSPEQDLDHQAGKSKPVKVKILG